MKQVIYLITYQINGNNLHTYNKCHFDVMEKKNISAYDKYVLFKNQFEELTGITYNDIIIIDSLKFE